MSIRCKINALFVIMVLANAFAGAQPLASGQCSRFSVASEGVYKIDYNLLKKSGFDADHLDPRNLHLYSNGAGMLPQANATTRQNQLRELAIFINGESDGKFDKNDFILFFGQGPDVYRFDTVANVFHYTPNIYSDKNFYFLTLTAENGTRMSAAENKPGQYPVVNSYNDFAYYEKEQFNILKSGRSWYGEQFNESTSITVQFDISGIVSNSPISITSRVMAQSYDAASSFRVFFNEVQILEHQLNPIDEYRYADKGVEDADSAVVTSDDVNAPELTTQKIRYQYTKAASDYSVGYLDNVLFSMTRKLAWNNSPIVFRSAESLSNTVSQFAIDNFPQSGSVWDVSDPFAATVQAFSFASGQTSFAVSTDRLKKFSAFAADKTPLAVFENAVVNQNLSAMTCPDLLIISHPDFKNEASRLGSFRQTNNHLSVLVITPQEIYNEYSGGKQDITALRDFVKDLSLRSGSGLDNLLLFGRCSYDYKNRVSDNTNYVPTYESINSLAPVDTYSSDDYFAFLGSNEGQWPEDPAINYTMDIGVGRIPVVTAVQAKTVVDKLIAYDTDSKNFGNWRSKIVFVADDGDNNLHQDSANGLATTIETLHPEIFTKKIYVDQFKQVTRPSGQYSPDTKDELGRTIDEGAVIVNYTGHGSEHLWMEEQVLDDDLIATMKNTNKLAFFVTATCEFGRHDDPFQLSNAENLLFKPSAGAIGLLTTARPVDALTNSVLNISFYQQLFIKAGGAYRDMGTVFRATKNASLSGVSNRNFSMLGDPSMRIALPVNQIVVTQAKTAGGSDTLKALSAVTIKGEIQTGGVINSGFNGDVSIILLDRPVNYVTKGDENPPYSYTQLNNIIFNGTATASSGKFEAEFILPQNIESTVGSGKMIVYGNSSVTDAMGYLVTKIGGMETDVPSDDQGPTMRLFMGDTTFADGGIASPNTTLVVRLMDENGIATSSFGGTNDMVAILDDSIQYNLNNYYTCFKDDFRNGWAVFPLRSLPKGTHHIDVTAFDTHGNKTASRVNFVVTEGNLVISSFYNYPNPFSAASKTTLGFTHNRPGEDLDVEVIILDLTGRMMVVWQYSVNSSQTDVVLDEWDGTTFAGNKLTGGIYLGKLTVRSLLDGSKNQLFTKLIIVN